VLHANLRQQGIELEEFIRLIVHDIKNPLSVIYGNAILLSKPQALESPYAAECVDEIRASSSVIERHLSNMLALTHHGDWEVSPEPIHLSIVVAQTVSLLQQVYKDRTLISRCEPHVYVLANRAAVEIALNNLITNAIKYSRAPEPIEIDVQHDGESCQLSVMDRGVGIAEDEQSLVFEPFYRARNGASMSTGLGIGLSISKNLIEACQGELLFESRTGGGSVFTVTLPCGDDLMNPDSEPSMQASDKERRSLILA
jgi:signal transduction histidine kinase